MTNKFILIGLNYSVIRYLVLFISLYKTYLIAKNLGPELLGSYTLIILVVEYLNYINLGVFNSMTRDVSVIAKNNNHENKENIIIGNALSFSLIASFFILILIIFILNLPSNVSNFIPNEIYKYLLLIFFLVLTFQFKQFILRHLRLYENYKAIGYIEFVAQVINCLGVYFFIELYLLDTVLYSILVANTILVILGLIFTVRVRLAFNPQLMSGLVKNGLPMLIQAIFLLILMSIDRAMIAFIYPERITLGLYQLGFILALGFFKAFESVTFLFQPKWFKFFFESDGQHFSKFASIKSQTILMEVVLVTLSVLGIIMTPFLITFFLPDYLPSIIITQFLLISFVLNGLTFFVNTYLISNKQEYKILPAIIVSCVFSVLLNYLLFQLGYGLYGFAFTKIIAFGIYGLVIYLILYNLLGLSFIKNFFRAYRRIFFLFVPSSIIIYEQNLYQGFMGMLLPTLLILLIFLLVYGNLIKQLSKNWLSSTYNSFQQDDISE